MLSPCTSTLSWPSLDAPIFSNAGRSTAMVLVDGQNDTGGLGRASGQLDAESPSKLSWGGFLGANRMFIASTMALVDSSLTGHSPV